MAIRSWRELARTFTNDIGSNSTLVRTFVFTIDPDLYDGGEAFPPETDFISEVGLDNWGAAHPLNAAFGLRKVQITERFQDSPYHVQLVAEYGICTANEKLAPPSRTPEWTFKAEPLQVAALYYWDGTTRKALTNSANDYYEGLETSESVVKVSRQQFWTTFPSTYFSTQNKINSGAFIGCPTHTVKVTGVNASKKQVVFGNVEYNVWDTTVDLMYRQSGWNLQLPDVGWNYISGGQKRRAMVFDFENNEWVASANPVALNGSGGQSSGLPSINERRVFEEANLADIYGTPF